MNKTLPRKISLVAIGCSAGCFESLLEILPQIDPNFPVPIVLVIHIPPDRSSLLPAAFKDKCKITVKEAEDKECLEAGTIYIAPPNYHLLIEPEGILALSSDEPVKFSRPSIDIFFESAAYAFGAGVVGIVLSGANEDGSAGLVQISAAGGIALIQDPQSARYPVMPLSAQKSAANAKIMSLQEITSWLKNQKWRIDV